MKRDFIFILALLAFQGYSVLPNSARALPPAPVKYAHPAQVAAAPQWTVTPSPLPSIEPSATPSLVPTPTLVPTATLIPTPTPISNGVRRVIIVSFDGMRADAIQAAGMTNLLALMQESAYTLDGRTIVYPTTLPSHSSMLTGMCMTKHGINFNTNNLYRGYAQGTDIFELTENAGMKSAMIVGKEKLQLIAEPETVEDFELYLNEAEIAAAAVRLIPADFDLIFVHFPSPDMRGHKFGWMSPTYFSALREGDAALGQILAALDENNMRADTLLIVTSDHGGHDRTHDGTRIEDYRIPWVVSGPGVVRGELQNAIVTMDTAATAAYALGLPIPADWDGLPSYEAFGRPAQDIHYNNGACE